MKQFFVIIILLFLGIGLFGQSDKLVCLIVNSLKIYEPNPSHAEASENSNMLFKDLVINSKDNFSTNLMEQFDHLYASGISNYEDNVDLRRIKMTQCLCFASIAMLSDKDRFDFFIDMAIHCITDTTGKAIEFLEKQHCGLILQRIYLKSKYKLNLQSDLIELNKYLDCYKASLPEDFYFDSKKIVENKE